MASSSSGHAIGDVGGELQQLKSLLDSGILNTAEFLRMSRELTQTNHEAHGTDDHSKDVEDSEPDLLVDESGNLLSPVSTPRSKSVASCSPVHYRSDAGSDMQSTSPPKTPTGESRKLRTQPLQFLHAKSLV